MPERREIEILVGMKLDAYSVSMVNEAMEQLGIKWNEQLRRFQSISTGQMLPTVSTANQLQSQMQQNAAVRAQLMDEWRRDQERINQEMYGTADAVAEVDQNIRGAARSTGMWGKEIMLAMSGFGLMMLGRQIQMASAPFFRLASDYAEFVGRGEESARQWLDATYQIEESKRRIGRVVASEVAPYMEDIANLAREVADLIEEHPEIAKAAAMFAAGAFGIGAMLQLAGMTMYTVGALGQVIKVLGLKSLLGMGAAAPAAAGTAGATGGVAAGAAAGGLSITGAVAIAVPAVLAYLEASGWITRMGVEWNQIILEKAIQSFENALDIDLEFPNLTKLEEKLKGISGINIELPDNLDESLDVLKGYFKWILTPPNLIPARIGWEMLKNAVQNLIDPTEEASTTLDNFRGILTRIQEVMAGFQYNPGGFSVIPETLLQGAFDKLNLDIDLPNLEPLREYISLISTPLPLLPAKIAWEGLEQAIDNFLNPAKNAKEAIDELASSTDQLMIPIDLLRAFYDYQQQIKRSEDKFNEDRMQINQDWNERALELEENYEERRAEIVEEWGQRRAELEEQYEQRRNEIIADYAARRAELLADYQQQETEAYQDYIRSRQKIIQDAHQQLADLERDHQKRLRDIYEQYRREAEDAVAARDALALVRAQRNLRDRLQDEQETYEERKAEIKRQMAERLAELKQQYELEKARRAQDFQERMNELDQQEQEQLDKLQEQFDERNEKLDEQYQTELDKLKKKHEDEMIELDKNYQDQLAALRKAHEDQLRLMRQNFATMLMWQDYYQAQMGANWSAFLAGLSADLTNFINSLPPVPAPSSVPGQQKGGYVYEGLWYLHDNEYVLNPKTTRMAEQITGNKLTQGNVLAAMLGSTGERTIALYQNFSFNGGFTEAEKRWFRQVAREEAYDGIIKAMSD